MKERLQKIISERGFTSRRNAEKLIIDGKVKVNGVVVTELGSKFEPNVKIEILNKIVTKDSNEKLYYLFFKPRATITTMYDPKKRKTVADYFKKLNTRVYPVGRLDYDVAGLLLMTNDGEFANFISHPRYSFFKTYQGLCDGKITNKDVKIFTKGVKIDDNYFTKAINSRLLNYNETENTSIVELTISEGKKHHVKKMFEAADFKLKKLMRTKIEFLEIGDLKPGEYRELKVHEIKKLYGIYNSINAKKEKK